MTAPLILSPVSRQLAVSDLSATRRFYRDFLGFDERSQSEGTLEFVRGPARILAEVGSTAPDSTMEPQPRGTALVILEVDQVEAIRNEIRARGGAPGPLEKANWLKMRLFEVRDPDGHVLWFGQSYHGETEPRHIPAGQGQLREMLPHLPLGDVAAGVDYYQRMLGFFINYRQQDLAVMYRDSVTVLLVARTSLHTGIGACTVYVADVDRLYQEFTAKGAKTTGSPVSQLWGLRDFTVEDPEGNRITFAQPFE